MADVNTHALEDRMESFFLAETTKYLYLLFDENNFIHQSPSQSAGYSHRLTTGLRCNPNAGGYVFNTEAHPIDPGALNCCHAPRLDQFDEAEYAARVLSNDENPINVQFLDELNSLNSTEFDQNTFDDDRKEFLETIDQVFHEPLESMPNSEQMIFSSILNQSMSPSKDNKILNEDFLQSWTMLRQFVEHTLVDDNSKLENEDFSSSTWTIKKPNTSLMSCPYPAFHHRFTVGGEILDFA